MRSCSREFPSLVAGLIGVVAKRLDVSPDRVFLLIGLLTFASGLLTIVVLFIRYIVNYATLTSVELDEAITRG